MALLMFQRCLVTIIIEEYVLPSLQECASDFGKTATLSKQDVKKRFYNLSKFTFLHTFTFHQAASLKGHSNLDLLNYRCHLNHRTLKIKRGRFAFNGK